MHKGSHHHHHGNNHNHHSHANHHHRNMMIFHAVRSKNKKAEEQKEGELREDKTCCNEEVRTIGGDILIGVFIIIIGFLVVAAIMHIRDNCR